MKNKIHKFDLETDYKINGNSTGCALDTLAIAVDGHDSNDIDENMFEAEDAAIDYVLELYDYESDMLKTATKKQLEEWLNDPQAQAVALSVFTDKLRRDSQDYLDSDTELAKELCEAVDAVHDQNYKEWINGDYRDWEGILSMASKRYSEREITFITDKGEVYAYIPDTTIAQWIEDGSIKYKGEARTYLEHCINTDARNQYEKRTREQAARKIERERLAAYKATQAQAAEVARQEKIKKLIKKA